VLFLENIGDAKYSYVVVICWLQKAYEDVT